MNTTAIESGNEPVVEAGESLALLAGERLLTAASSRDRRFVIALASTAFLHAVFVIGIARSVPRYVGDPSGADNAISIAIVTEADLKSLSIVPESGDRPPGAPGSTAQPRSQPQPETPQAKPAPPEALRQSLTEDAATTESGPTPAPKKPAAKVQTQPQPPPKPKQSSAKLDLTPPAPSFDAPIGAGGKSAGLERPPGITRSGANDEFARNVIRALKKTMPQLSDTFGRVKVRIILNQNGNVEDVRVMIPSNVAGLDQSVVFSVKQASFPFPPPNSIDVDRIFQVTYIYH